MSEQSVLDYAEVVLVVEQVAEQAVEEVNEYYLLEC